MSKYIDIVKIMRENKKFSLKLDIMIEYKENYSWDRCVVNYLCSVENNTLFLDNGDRVITFDLYEKEGREKTAKRFHEMLFDGIKFSKKAKKVNIKITINDYLFWLKDRIGGRYDEKI